MLNIDVDWKAFEYKFSSNPRQAFENLSYILFCHEFKQNYGVFRYFNHPHIETQPINTLDGYLTGFQSKYYDSTTRISSKETELKDAIKGAKEKYKINRIIFYINKELSASNNKSSQKPKYQLNIEKYGSDMGIKVEWRVKSNFEKMLICDELNVVRDLYFNPNTGIQDFINGIHTRSDAILKNIKSKINYLGQEIKIVNEQQKLNDFLSSENDAFIVYGDAGSGKSGYIKDFILNLKDNYEESEYLLFAASDMDVEEEILFLKQYGNYTLNDLFGLYKSEKLKVCIIDAAV